MEHNDGVEVLPVEREEAAESSDEKATRGTEAEAAEIELELSRALQDLLRRLNAGSLSRPDTGRVESLPRLDAEEFGDFFRSEGRECRTRTEVRLKVLEALGSCRTLRSFRLVEVQDWNLTVTEWEALVRPMQMQPNSHLEKISIYAFDTAEEEELIGPYLAKLISQSQMLKSLTLVTSGRFTAKFAAEIASGVRARARAHDQLVELSFDFHGQLPGEEEGVLQSVADIISGAPKLEILGFEDASPCHATSFLRGHAKEALAGALRGIARLKLLSVSYVAEEMLDVLAEVYTGTSSNAIVENLELSGDMGGRTAEALALLLRGNITTIIISVYILYSDLSFLPFRPDEWQDIGKCLVQPPTLVKFEFRIFWKNLADTNLKVFRKSLQNALVELGNTSRGSHVLRISVDVEIMANSKCSQTLSFLEETLDYPCLKSLRIHYFNVGTMEFKSFVDKLATNSSLEELGITKGESSSKDGWTYLFSRLRNNTSITALDLSHSQDLDDDNFRDVIDLLQVNYTLRSIKVDETVWEEDGKMALIEAALQRNTKQERYFSDLREAKLSFDGAKAGRIFFCGAAFAGKTTLKVTMMETMEKKSRSESVLYKLKEKLGKWIEVPKCLRTQGIEVELLCDDQSATISIWDLAGQEIFRALHHLLFPRINQACIFVFVFNPLEGKGKNRTLKQKMQEAFAQELRSWLRFIVSNTQITGSILPHMLVIITHKDKLETCSKNLDLTITELKTIVKNLQQQYKDAVNLCPIGDGITDHDDDPLIYQVNAKAKVDVEPIKALLLRSMKEVLERKSPRVPKACSELVSHLLGRPDKVQRSPLWSFEQFYNFCFTGTPLLKDFGATDKRGRSVLHAVTSYMHDSGTICMTPSAMEECGDNPSNNPKKSVVVDLNWLTQNLLGKIISHWNGFDVQSGRASASDPSDLTTGFDGFIGWDELFDLIGRIIEEKSRRNVSKEVLKELLFELDLCYRIGSKEGPDRVFMPLLFGASTGIASMNLRWSLEPAEGSDHFGFRVQCLDKEKTSLSAGFYPRYQIYLRKQMRALGVIDENFLFSRFHVEFGINGCLVFVEIDQSAENHIDVMVKFSKGKRDWAMDFVQEHIVRDLMQFGASEKGCPGMQLVVLILRTECVKQLTPRHMRTEAQAVVREELKRRFHNYVENQLGKEGVQSKSLFGYQHTWPEIKTTSSLEHDEFYLPREFQAAETLLSTKDVNDVLIAVGKKHEDFWENSEEMYQISSRLNDPSIKLDLGGAHPQCEESSFHRRYELESLASLMSRPSFNTRVDISVGEKIIIRGMLHLEDTVKASTQELKDTLTNFKSSLDIMRSRMSHLTSKVDKIIGYERSKMGHKTPRLPYFTIEDVSLTQRVKAAVLFGKAVRIHLMCEARHRPHFVDNQPGLELHFEKEDRFSKSMRVLSVVSLHMIWVLLKVGAQVTAGLGSVVPTISSLGKGVAVGVSASSNLVLDRLQLQVKENLPLVENQLFVKEAWCCLRDYLAPNLTADKCANLFRLHLVKYRNSDDPYAWLCESCMLRGRKNFLLEW